MTQKWQWKLIHTPHQMSSSTTFSPVARPNRSFNADANTGHAFGILMACVGALRTFGAPAPLTLVVRLPMKAAFTFTFEKDWRTAPVAFWVHVPVKGSDVLCNPPAPEPIPHKGYAFLRVEFGLHELLFSAPAQLDHFIEVLATKPLPTTRSLSSKRNAPVGPNGHWLSRLPASLKSPRTREKLVHALQLVRTTAHGPGPWGKSSNA